MGSGPDGRWKKRGWVSISAVRIGVTVTPAPSLPPGSGRLARLGWTAVAMHRRVAPRMVPRPCCAPGCSRGSSSPPRAAPPTWRPPARRWARRTAALAADLGDEDAVTAAASALGAVDTLVCDAAAPFAAAGGGVEGLGAGLDGAWNATRAVANAVWIPGDGGKLVLLGPRPRDGAHAGALGAALENTARTLSIEWARYAIRTTAVLPGDATSDEDVAQLVAYLASPAGDYFSGCAFAMGRTPARVRRPSIREGGRIGRRTIRGDGRDRPADRRGVRLPRRRRERPEVQLEGARDRARRPTGRPASGPSTPARSRTAASSSSASSG